jgi:Rod binding domain-containing protein
MSQDLAGLLGGVGQAQTTTLGAAMLKAANGQRQRVEKAAQEFEGQLLASWLESAEENDRAMGGEDDEAGGDTMGTMGTQALAMGIAARGGIGLAKLLLKHLPLPPAGGTSAAAEAGKTETTGTKTGEKTAGVRGKSAEVKGNTGLTAQ